MCLDKYLASNTATAESYSYIADQPFPELTVCPSLPYKENILARNGIPARKYIQLEADWVSNDSRTTPEDLFEQVVYNLEDLVEDLTLYLETPSNGNASVFFPSGGFNNICNKTVFRYTDYYYNGRCFSLQLPQCILNLGVLELILHFRKKVDIFIHHEGQFFSPNSRARVDVMPGQYKKIAVNHEVGRILFVINIETQNNKTQCIISFLRQDNVRVLVLSKIFSSHRLDLFVLSDCSFVVIYWQMCSKLCGGKSQF